MIHNSLLEFLLVAFYFLNDIDLVLLFLYDFEVLLLLQVVFVLLSFFLLLDFGNFVQPGFDDGVDLSSDVALSQVVLLEMREQIRGFLGVALEKSDHLKGVLGVQLGSVWQVVYDFVVLCDFVDVGESHVAEVNPLDGV